ncbi:unnamed protein product [Adineta ricciae]|uniref:G-protein coupled receptors family 1 profile domain-containing protein n=1 Tax=Adineta ricciae TaxID=249248 RepID=A0A815N9C1_ADIRI|nr:unnamed protein product [Adineta ricciae]CAF1435133.1 unnamed protein product [Adineta ricciae]
MTELNNTLTPVVIESWFIPLDIIPMFALILTIISDCIFLIVIIFDKACHTLQMMFIAYTCFAQLLTSINMTWVYIFRLENDLKQLQYYNSMCLFRGYFTPASCAMMIHSFTLQTFHRYMTAVHPTHLFWQSIRTQLFLICISFVFCLLFPLIPLLAGYIVYNVYNQNCEILFSFNFGVIWISSCTYNVPVVIIIFLYFRLILYAKSINNVATAANVFSRAQRELKMVKQIVILVSMLLIFGVPYVTFIVTSFFTNIPLYHYRISHIFVVLPYPVLIATLFYFTEPLKDSLKKNFSRRRNLIGLSTTFTNR